MASARSPRQLSLLPPPEADFEVPVRPEPLPGALDFDSELRQALSRALKASPLSRYQVAAGMSELLGDDVSKHMLDAYTAESRETHAISVTRFVALVMVTGAVELLGLVAGKCGCRLLEGDEVLVAELGSIERQMDALKRRRKHLLKEAPTNLRHLGGRRQR